MNEIRMARNNCVDKYTIVVGTVNYLSSHKEENFTMVPEGEKHGKEDVGMREERVVQMGKWTTDFLEVIQGVLELENGSNGQV